MGLCPRSLDCRSFLISHEGFWVYSVRFTVQGFSMQAAVRSFELSSTAPEAFMVELSCFFSLGSGFEWWKYLVSNRGNIRRNSAWGLASLYV